MISNFEQFIEKHLPLAGIVACGMRLPDRSQVCRCFTDELTPAQMDQAVNRLTLAADSLNRHRLDANRFCWTFERMCVHLALRPDGTALIVLSESSASRTLKGAAADLLEHFSPLST